MKPKTVVKILMLAVWTFLLRISTELAFSWEWAESLIRKDPSISTSVWAIGWIALGWLVTYKLLTEWWKSMVAIDELEEEENEKET